MAASGPLKVMQAFFSSLIITSTKNRVFFNSFTSFNDNVLKIYLFCFPNTTENTMLVKQKPLAP